MICLRGKFLGLGSISRTDVALGGQSREGTEGERMSDLEDDVGVMCGVVVQYVVVLNVLEMLESEVTLLMDVDLRKLLLLMEFLLEGKGGGGEFDLCFFFLLERASVPF